MANIKISELNELEQVDNDDLLVIVDTSANETKKVKARNVGTGGGGSDVVVISDTEPTNPDTKLWIDTGEVGESFSEITNEYSTSTGKGYSANYINDKITPTSYTLTDTPSQSFGTNKIFIDKIGNLVVMNVLIFLNSITANNWVNVGKLPDDILISTERSIYVTGNLSDANTGALLGIIKVDINNGYIRVKSLNTSSSACSIQFNATYVI